MKKKILIIEDEKPMAQLLKSTLEHEGFVVKNTINGKEGLLLLSKETFNLILLDLVIPRVDGFEVLKELKEKKITTPIMVLTNLGQSEDEKKARDLGALEFFIKADISMTDIIKKVKDLLSK